MQPLQYNGELIISEAKSRKATSWKGKTILWGELLAKLSVTKRTDETAAEFAAMTRDVGPPGETVGHTGFTGTSFALDPATGLYVIFLTNRCCPSRDNMAIYRVRRLLHNAVYACGGK